MKTTGTLAEINLENLEHNLNEIKRYLKNETKICGVVKANAYGHGAVEIAKFLEYKGIDYLSVARVEEALELRKNGIKKPILCMGATNMDFLDDAIKNDVTLTVFDKLTADLINEEAVKHSKEVLIHIKINSGMNRIGFNHSTNSINDILYINNLSNLKIEGIFTHFAKADEYDKTATFNQLKVFNSVVEELENNGINFDLKHVSNSATIIDLKELDCNMVRAGIALYGMHPSTEVQKRDLKPLLKLKSKVVDSKIISKGDGVSYGYNFIASKDTQVVTLSIGYADGFPRTQKNGIVVINNNGKFILGKIIGNICMDQCMVEVDNLNLIPRNSEVFIIDNIEGITAEDVAKRINTINYEIICMISRRVSRIYKYKDKEYIKNYLF